MSHAVKIMCVYISYIYTHTQFERGQLCANLAAEYVCVYTHTYNFSVFAHAIIIQQLPTDPIIYWVRVSIIIIR